ncbi:MAG: hypothetical protein QG588_257, partial [Candidatus Poribacteria bacterium]|nr:hypothetical protein [Candidatus Poribacteria bacterium]
NRTNTNAQNQYHQCQSNRAVSFFNSVCSIFVSSLLLLLSRIANLIILLILESWVSFLNPTSYVNCQGHGIPKGAHNI